MITTPLKNLAAMAVAPWVERGFVQTVRSIHEYVHAQRQERIDAFDRRFGTETGRHVSYGDLNATGHDVQALWRYFPTLEAPFRRVLDALPIRFEDYVFVDLGCGKGRAILLASERPFRSIIGVELSPDLHGRAQRNLEIYRSPTQRCRSFELVCADAALYTPPPTSTVFYLFQPFPIQTMSAVLAQLTRSLLLFPRPIAVAYMNPLFDRLVMDTGLFARRRTGRATRPGEFDWTLYLHDV